MKKTWPSRSSSRRTAALDLTVLVGADVGQHRMPLFGRGGDRGHLADAGDRHLEGARDRRGAHARARRPRCAAASSAPCARRRSAAPRRPRSGRGPSSCMSGLSRRWVPTTMSTVPSARPAITSRRLACRSGSGRARLSTTGKPLIRSAKVERCWVHEQRRGHEYGDLLAVLDGLERPPAPRSRSCRSRRRRRPAGPSARCCIMSALTSSTVLSWSGVSLNGKASSSSRCHGVSAPKA